MSNAKVTVCIPSYNHERYISAAIESVLNQISTDFELLIIDDGSDDGTPGLIRHFAERDPRIRFKINSVNIGMIPNWNLCLAEAEGEYIKYLCSDDLLSSPAALQRMAATLDADRSISLVASSRALIDSDSRLIRVLAPFAGSGVQPGKMAINRCLYEQNNLIGEPTAVMFRKADALRGFLPHYRQIVDEEMWFHLLEKGKFAFIDEPLCSFRIHSDQQTSRNANTLAALRDLFHLFDEYMTKSYISVTPFYRRYIRFDNLYKIWKMYAAGNISKQQARTEIEARFGYGRFRLIYPFYKLYKPLLKLRRRLARKRSIFPGKEG